MTRIYRIEWNENKAKNYGNQPLIKHTLITLSNPTGNTAVDAKAALNIFATSVSNLKKANIIRIQEMDENGQIGEDIVPAETENAIVPTGR